MSSEEEMTDDFDEPSSPPKPFPFTPFQPVDLSNKPEKPLLEQYEETRRAEEATHAGRRQAAIQRIRACLAQNPKLDVSKPSELQEKIANLTDEQLEFAADGMEDQLGISSTHAASKGVLKIADAILKQAGYALDPKAFEDVTMLSVISKKLPNASYYFQDWINMVAKMAEYVVVSRPAVDYLAIPAPVDPPLSVD